MNTQKTAEELIKGCGKKTIEIGMIEEVCNEEIIIKCGDKKIEFTTKDKGETYYGKTTDIILLCPTCKAKLTQLKSDCEDFLEFLESFNENELDALWIIIPRADNMKEYCALEDKIAEQITELKTTIAKCEKF